MSDKTKITALMIFKIIALLFGLLLWFAGFFIFRGMLGQEMGGIIGWIIWGFVTLFCMPVDLISYLIKGAREGAIEGANTYKIKDWGSSYTISNSPTGGAFKGIIINAGALILVGPVLLAFKIIGNFFTVLQCIFALRRINAESNDN